MNGKINLARLNRELRPIHKNCKNRIISNTVHDCCLYLCPTAHCVFKNLHDHEKPDLQYSFIDPKCVAEDNLPQENMDSISKLREHIAPFYFHRNIKNSQHNYYDKVMNELEQDSKHCMVVCDFKANIILGQSREILSLDYRKPLGRTCFNATLLFFENGKKTKLHYNFISDYMDHNSLFIVYVIKKLLKTEPWILNQFDKFTFFNDGAPTHFKT